MLNCLGLVPQRNLLAAVDVDAEDADRGDAHEAFRWHLPEHRDVPAVRAHEVRDARICRNPVEERLCFVQGRRKARATPELECTETIAAGVCITGNEGVGTCRKRTDATRGCAKGDIRTAVQAPPASVACAACAPAEGPGCD